MNHKILLPLDIYNKHLKKINDVSFTYREIDVISALLNMEGNRLASFLSIQPRGVETHTRNIRQKAGGLSDQKAIIDFIQKSQNFSLLKHEYFLHLQIRLYFEKQLRKFSKIINNKKISCSIINEEHSECSTSLIPLLREHLKLAGIKLESVSKKKGNPSFLDLREEKNELESHFLLYVMPQDIEQVSQLAKETMKNTKTILLCAKNGEKTSGILDSKAWIDIENQNNYYAIFFEILKVIVPNFNFENTIAELNTYCVHIRQSCKKSDIKNYSSLTLSITKTARRPVFEKMTLLSNGLKKQKKQIILSTGILGTLLCILIVIWLYSPTNSLKISNTETIQSDLLIPTQATLLNRSNLLLEIHSKLMGTQGIQTVALVGCGGAGKTTLARQYAQQQNTLVGEINAETKETLIASLEALAYVTSTTHEEKRELRDIQEIKNPSKREGQLLIFLKRRLKAQPHWLLIYDNVESLTDIQPYFPNTQKNWGKGKVIITTQDINTNKNSYIENMKIVNVKELNDAEKVYLFNKILDAGEEKLTHFYKDDAQKINFLKEIPPFPLDVSTAAYFLKDRKVSYNQYLNALTTQLKYFDESQHNILTSVGKYTKTRYAIIALFLQKIINIHADFKDLLLLISILDSQKIPKNLLYYYKNNNFVENFLDELKKRSLITEENNQNNSSTFSIHRSVQKIFLSCLINKYRLHEDSASLYRLGSALEKYVSEKIDAEDIVSITPLVNHLEKLLKNKNILPPMLVASIEAELGFIYYYIPPYGRGKELLIKSINALQSNKQNFSKQSRIFSHLASVYTALGDFEKGLECHIQSTNILKKYFPKDYLKIASYVTNLGNAYRYLGEYGKAKDALEYAHSIFKNKSLQHHIAFAHNLISLGRLYRSLGEHIKAKIILEEGVIQYERHLSKNHFRSAWASVHLAHTYNDLKLYNEALELLEQAFLIYKKDFSVNHRGMAWVLAHLGYTYKGLQKYEQAKQAFENALIFYKKTLPEDHIEIAQTLAGLASLKSRFREQNLKF